LDRIGFNASAGIAVGTSLVVAIASTVLFEILGAVMTRRALVASGDPYRTEEETPAAFW